MSVTSFYCVSTTQIVPSYAFKKHTKREGGSMMITFVFLSYTLGVAAAAALGPMFVLVFNRSASRGAWAGIATGMGAALTDGCYFFLGLLGTLNIIQSHPAYTGILHVLGGCALAIFGASFLVKTYKPITVQDAQTRYGMMFMQGVGMTIFNPMVVFFFMAASIKVLSSYSTVLTLADKVLGSLSLSCGSLSVFVLISLSGHYVGHKISHKTLSMLQLLTGVFIFCIGIYVLFSAREVLTSLLV